MKHLIEAGLARIVMVEIHKKDGQMMKTKHLSALLAATLTLTACQTMDNMQSSIGGLFDTNTAAEDTEMAAKSNEMAETIVAAGQTKNCPSVQIMADLKEMHEFTDFTAPSDTNKVSEIEIMEVDAACSPEDEAIAVKIDITFDGQVGPQARQRKSDTANFSYPYFVAVTDADGKILAKEIFAASVSYSSGQDTIKQIETINQLLPRTNDVTDYTVLLGFQLNEDQLIYNRTQIAPAAGEETTIDLE
ncbi:MAG: hypothetical protein AAF569_04885 [Pseudomonadota bacterium]